MTMTRPAKTKTDLFAALEDDVKQFRDALFGAIRAAASDIAARVRQTTQAETKQLEVAKEKE
jgi:hypothetical protein